MAKEDLASFGFECVGLPSDWLALEFSGINPVSAERPEYHGWAVVTFLILGLLVLPGHQQALC